MLITLGKHPLIWEHFPENRSDEAVHLRYLMDSLALQQARQHCPYVIRLLGDGGIAGYTRLHSWNIAHRCAETGSWLHPNFWRTGINVESKWVLLRYCFEELGLVRVQFRTSPANIRSRRALERLGASFEGILRNDRIMPDGSVRSTALYSIIAQEWPQVSQHLQARMERACTPGPATTPRYAAGAGIF